MDRTINQLSRARKLLSLRDNSEIYSNHWIFYDAQLRQLRNDCDFLRSNLIEIRQNGIFDDLIDDLEKTKKFIEEKLL